MSFEEIVAALPTLQRAQLEELRSRISAFLALGAGASVVTSPFEMSDEDFILDLIIEIAALRGCGYIGKDRLRAQSAFSKEKVEGLMRFIREQLPKGQRIEQRVLLHLGMRIMCEHLVKIGLPSSHKIILTNLHRIPEFLDRAFPGYAAMGLLGMVIAKEAKEVKKGNVRNKSDSR